MDWVFQPLTFKLPLPVFPATYWFAVCHFLSRFFFLHRPLSDAETLKTTTGLFRGRFK